MQRTVAANTSLAVYRFQKQYFLPCSTVQVDLTALQFPTLLVMLFFSFGSFSNIVRYKQIVCSFTVL